MLDEIIVALDLETTGLNPEHDRIIDVGLVKIKGDKIIDRFQSLANPGFRVPSFISAITGIKAEDLGKAPAFTELKDKIKKFIGKHTLLGHNLQFDLAFLSANGLKFSNQYFDTFELAPITFPGLTSYALGYLSDRLALEHLEKHRALSDAEATAYLFQSIVREIEKIPLEQRRQLAPYLERGLWPAARLFLPDTLKEIKTEIKAESVAAKESKGKTTKKSKAHLHFDSTEVQRIFAAGGKLSKLNRNFEARSGQQEMVRIILEALQERKALAVEAGTGVGKTLAYLVPLLTKALSEKQKVLLATYTTTLQDQVLERDLPTLNKIFSKDLGRDLHATVLKGRSHYLCHQAWRNLLRKTSFTPEEIRVIIKVWLWLKTTQTGERQELSLQREENQVWYRIAGNTESCLGSKCPSKQQCFVSLARERAKQSDLVITNQALLLTDSQSEKGIVPPYDYLVVDEAQHLEEVATNRYTLTFNSEILWAHLKELESLLRSYLKTQKENLFSNRELSSQIEELLDELAKIAPRLDILAGLCGMLGRFLGERSRRDSFTYRIYPELENYLEWRRILDAVKHLHHSLDLLSDQAGRIASASFRQKESDPAAWDLTLALEAWNELNQAWLDKLSKIFFSNFENKVAWIRMNFKEQIFIEAAPLQVAEFLQKELFLPERFYLLCSATLAAGKDFTYLKRSLGLDPELPTAIIPSDFDYRKQAALFVPLDFPAPQHANFMREVNQFLVGLVETLQGRTLVLFTAHRAVENAYTYLHEHLTKQGINVLAQGLSGARNRILESFRADPRSVILGANSFWEGVDLPGDILQAVVIVKLPFDVPDDPLYEARSELYVNPFADYALPRAILRFKQGIGRLIRTKADRGVIVVLDNRLRTQDYGEKFYLSLPDCEVHELPAEELLSGIKRFMA